MILKCVYFLSVYIISEIMLFLSLRRRRTIKKKLKTWDLQRQHLTFLLVEVQKNLDIDFIVCTVTCKYWFWYWFPVRRQILHRLWRIVIPCLYLHSHAISRHSKIQFLEGRKLYSTCVSYCCHAAALSDFWYKRRHAWSGMKCCLYRNSQGILSNTEATGPCWGLTFYGTIQVVVSEAV